MKKILSLALTLSLAWACMVPALAENPYVSINDDLLYRATFGRAEDIAILLKKGGDPNLQNDLGWTVLALALDREDAGAEAAAKVLIEGGADINLKGRGSPLPILLAARNGKSQSLKLIIDRGGDIYYQEGKEGDSVYTAAKSSKDEETIKVIQDALDADKKRLSDLHSPENFNKLLKDYIFNTCAFTYWSYYQASKQDEDVDPAALQKTIADHREKINVSARDILTNFPSVKVDKLQTISNDIVKKITDKLDFYVTNRNRKQNGVGKTSDMDKRCNELVGTWQVDIAVPAAGTAPPAAR